MDWQRPRFGRVSAPREIFVEVPLRIGSSEIKCRSFVENSPMNPTSMPPSVVRSIQRPFLPLGDALETFLAVPGGVSVRRNDVVRK